MAPRRRQRSGKVPAGLASTGHLAGQPGHVQSDNVALARVPWRVGVGLHTNTEARHGGRPRGPEAHPGPRLPNPVARRPGSGRPGSPAPAGSLKPDATSQVGSEGAAQAAASRSRGQENLQRVGRQGAGLGGRAGFLCTETCRLRLPAPGPAAPPAGVGGG